VIDQQQVCSFLSALFEPTDLIEFRAIETWTQNGRKHSRPIDRTWLTPHEVIRQLPRLERLNRSANIFLSVNPRMDRGGTKADVAVCRSVWVDLDNISLEGAADRWQGINMPPTMAVNSGHGIHAYWKLVNPVPVTDPADRSHVEAIVKAFAKVLGGDATHDCSRLLRLAGTWNVKDRRNGVSPTPCTLVSHNDSLVYQLSAFEGFVVPKEVNCPGVHARSGADLECVDVKTPSLGSATMGRSRDQRRIQGVLRYLDREVSDRSRRDHGALVLLIQCGLSKAEVYSLVINRSKFLEAGDAYFERTYRAALRSLGSELT
jgi:hypothetical protein